MKWILAALAALLAFQACTPHAPHQQSYRWGINHATIDQQEGGTP